MHGWPSTRQVARRLEKRDRVRSTRGSRVIRPWHRGIQPRGSEPLPCEPTRGRSPSGTCRSLRISPDKILSLKWRGGRGETRREKAGYQATCDALWTMIARDIFIPRAIERVGAGWISNLSTWITFVEKEDDEGVSSHIFERQFPRVN